MMTRSVTLIAIAALAGCAAAQKTYLADGSEGYSIDCSGQALNWGYCDRKAGELCGARGYEVLGKEGEQGGPTLSGNQFGLYSTQVMSRSMMIRCNG